MTTTTISPQRQGRRRGSVWQRYLLRPAHAGLQRIQNELDFHTWNQEKYPQVASKTGLGRVSLIALLLGLVGGIHGVLYVQWQWGLLLQRRDEMLETWCLYMMFLTTFHWSEFWITALYNPKVLTADSFVVNQSKAYTLAAMMSWLEFWCRWWWRGGGGEEAHFGRQWIKWFGCLLVVGGQVLRSAAMMTCGESFNHFIQRQRKHNHVLVTHGVYRYLCHPSYTGFFYWSIGTQLVLGNGVCCFLYGVAVWKFFQRRIPYEEDSLLALFPEDYPAYRATTWIGIPFFQTTTPRMPPNTTTTNGRQVSPTRRNENETDTTTTTQSSATTTAATKRSSLSGKRDD